MTKKKGKKAIKFRLNFNLSIGKKIFLATFLPFLLIMIFISFASINNKANLENELIFHNIESYVSLLESSDLSFASVQDKEKLELFFNEKLFSAELYNLDGEIIYGPSSNSIVSYEDHNNNLQKALDGYIIRFNEDNRLFVYYPIVLNKRVIGVLHLELSSEEFNYRVNSYALSIIMLNLFGLLLAFIIIYFLVKRILVLNLKKITGALGDLKEGNLNAVIKINSNDEFSQVANGFNEMVSELRRSRFQLIENEKNQRKILKKSVDLATKKLKEKIAKEEKASKAMLYILERSKRLNKQIIDKDNSILEQQRKLRKSNKELKSAKSQIEKFNKNLETMVKKRTEELQKANVKISGLLHMKSQFVNQVAHDLRTPLTPMTLLLPILKKKVTGKLDKKDMEKFDVILSNAKYLNMLVHDTLNISRLDAGTVEFDFQPVDVKEIVNLVIEDNKVVFERDNVKIINNAKGNLPLVRADKTRIREVYENLIMNSIKFMSESAKKSLAFGADVGGKYVTFKIKDSGIGIEKDKIGKIFDEFYKVDQSRHEHSSGLGLAICLRLIKKHGGRIWAESKGKGKGTTMCFTLPIAKKQ